MTGRNLRYQTAVQVRAPEASIKGDSTLTKLTGEKVAGLVRTLAAAKRLTVAEVCEQSGITDNTYHRLMSEHFITHATLSKLKAWARKYTK